MPEAREQISGAGTVERGDPPPEPPPSARSASRASAVLAVVLAAAVGVCLAIAVVRTAGWELPYPFLVVIAYTPYFGIAALALAFVAAVARKLPTTLAAVAATMLIAAAVLPRMIADERTVTGTGLTLMAINLNSGEADAEAVVALAERERPDVLSLEELTPNMVHQLAHAGLGSEFPRRVITGAKDSDGTGIYTRLPTQALEGVAPGLMNRPLSHAWITSDPGPAIDMTSVHPRSPTNPDKADLWSRTLEALPAEPDDAIGVLLGDFNASLDHAELRDVLDRGYVDAADVAGAGLDPTWPVSGSPSPPLTLDHILVPEGSAVPAFETFEVSGSDHRAVVAQVIVPDD